MQQGAGTSANVRRPGGEREVGNVFDKKREVFRQKWSTEKVEGGC